MDPSGNLTSSGTFDVYGAKRAGGTGSPSTRQGFVGSLGHVTDSETGLIYMRARYYDPQTGRFISEDSNKNGANWFAYCDGNPVDRSDTSGASWQEAFSEICGGLAAGLTVFAFTLFLSQQWTAAINAANIAAFAWVGVFVAPDAKSQDNGLAEMFGGGLAGGLVPAVRGLIAFLAGNAALARACPGGFALIAIMGVVVEGAATLMACEACDYPY